MAITLNDASVTAVTRYRGGGNFTVPAGQHLKIEISPAGDDILDTTCPAGKTWEVNVSMNITETDA